MINARNVTPCDNRSQRLDEARQQNAATIQGEECNENYLNEWKKFKDWVDENLDVEELDQPSPYLTRFNVDMYFQLEVVNRTGARNHINRIKNALEWYAKYHEYADGSETFVVDSLDVQRAMLAQARNYAQSLEDGDDEKCPHRFCKDSMSMNDREKLLRAAYLRADFGSSSVAINLGQDAAVRGASTRKFVLSDLRISRGFGPEGYRCSDSPFSRALMMILRRGRAHKDRFTTIKQVCFWRHKKYLLDGNFAMAIITIWKLWNHGNSIKFQKPPGQTKRPKWWDIPLIDWRTYNCKFHKMKWQRFQFFVN